uniref:asparagine synthase-related protein n=4 Tax=Bacteroidota TaxID=976 RepID=UPI004048086E
VYKPKHGFNVPLEEWVVTKFFTYLEEILLDRQCLDRGIFKEQYIIKMLAETKAGKVTYTRKLWLLLNFELWCRKNL